MPLITSEANDTVTTEAADILSFARWRQSTAGGIASTRSVLNLLARDRAINYFNPSIVTTPAVVTSVKRLRGSSAADVQLTEAELTFWVSTPSHPDPEITLTVGDQLFKDYKIAPGSSVQINFLITGHKLEILSVFFTLSALNDTPLLSRVETLDPGGAVVDEFIQLPDGRQQAKGSIFLLPYQTKNLPEEVRYTAGVKNKLTQNTVCDCGFLTFHCN